MLRQILSMHYYYACDISPSTLSPRLRAGWSMVYQYFGIVRALSFLDRCSVGRAQGQE